MSERYYNCVYSHLFPHIPGYKNQSYMFMCSPGPAALFRPLASLRLWSGFLPTYGPHTSRILRTSLKPLFPKVSPQFLFLDQNSDFIPPCPPGVTLPAATAHKNHTASRPRRSRIGIPLSCTITSLSHVPPPPAGGLQGDLE